ncbi:hypothetical protein [Pseudonocardia humida]|uniref:Allene oxide cyclase barrel-like domain-containing protein n=1 Tax=Pseudonocardia humida TaxID=2800819 RepID=A0ABT1A9E7_9PSEU|nr:hypothetical protein [Pseudonocardia humida]MCO1659649.1 hypothetical protein [Pseudonocardia humida]
MLHARRQGAFRYSYLITEDGGVPVTTLTQGFRDHAEFELAGVAYRMRMSGIVRRQALLEDPDGRPVAGADRLGRRSWTVTAPGSSHEFERVGLFGTEYAHVVEGRRVGSIRRTGFWRTGAQADLPALPRPLAVFTFAVALVTWQQNDAASSG